VPLDPTGHDPILRLLAYAHPLWMLASLTLAFLALRSGLRMRSARRRSGARRDPKERTRHLRLAKTALAMLLLGFSAGLASAVWLRGWEIFHTAHAFVSSTALLGFLTTGVLGRRLERGHQSVRELHGLLALLSTLLAVAAFGTGFVLLP